MRDSVHKSHNWKAFDGGNGYAVWKCQQCGIEDVDQLALSKCPKNKIIRRKKNESNIRQRI